MLKRRPISLNASITWLLIFCLLAGLSSMYFWNLANTQLKRHYEASYNLGLKIYEASRFDYFQSLLVEHVDLKIENPKKNKNVVNIVTFEFEKISTDYKYMTEFFLNSYTVDSQNRIRVYKKKRKFEIAELKNSVAEADQYGRLSALLAQRCDDTILAIQGKKTSWALIQSPKHWSCAAKPFDWRWVSILIMIITVSFLVFGASNIAKPFERLAKIFQNEIHYLDMKSLEQAGTTETQSIAKSVNKFIDVEARRLEKRIDFFTAMSHDLGTPATRIRLRAELIEDASLRVKFINDIDHLTEMIKASLHFMRHETEKELPRVVDFGSLMETISNEYQDLGHSVAYQKPLDLSFEYASTAFSNSQGKTSHFLQEKRIITVFCQPLNIRRAIENLIDNGLKFGEAVILQLSADSKFVYVQVIDNGGGVLPQELNKISSAFYQGKNNPENLSEKNNDLGFGNVGLGLAIVGNIMDAHDGILSFNNDEAHGGLVVSMKIPRQRDVLDEGL